MKLSRILTMAILTGLMTTVLSFTTIHPTSKAEFAEKTHQFNQIQVGTPVVTTFKFKNTSDKPLIVKNVKTSCGCTAPSYPKAPIFSGDSGEITVKYDAAKVGKFKKSITVQTNVDDAPIILYIEGEVVGK